jgi:hypothetical protein
MLQTSPPPLRCRQLYRSGKALIVTDLKVTRSGGSLKQRGPESDYKQHARSAGRDPP